MVSTLGAQRTQERADGERRGDADERLLTPEAIRQLTGDERAGGCPHEHHADYQALELHVRGDPEVLRQVFERGVDDAEVVAEREGTERGDEDGGKHAPHHRVVVQRREHRGGVFAAS
jgi:hypothetical protein